MKLLAAALLLTAAMLPAQDWAKAKLDSSPRHHEYATLSANGRPLKAFVSYPEVKTKATAIVLVPEIFGLSDWAKEMADELSASGYVVIAPDVLTGMGPNGGGTESFTSRDSVTQAVSGLDNNTVMADLDAAANYVKTLPASSGTLAVAGFCWGGGKSFAFATHRHDLVGAFVFYGPPPSADDMKEITAPVYGFYAGNDARIGATLPQATADMKAANKAFYPVTYDGAGHGFMRAGEDPADTNPANKAARAQAYAKMTSILTTKSTAKASALRTPHNARKQPRPAAASLQCHGTKTLPGKPRPHTPSEIMAFAGRAQSTLRVFDLPSTRPAASPSKSCDTVLCCKRAWTRSRRIPASSFSLSVWRFPKRLSLNC